MNENGEVGEREGGNGVKTQKIVGKLLGRSRTEMEEQGDGGGGSNSDCDRVPSGDKKGIGKQDIGCGNGQGGDRNGRPGDSEDGWREGELVCYLQSTRIRVIEGLVLLQMQ